jgi:hypothetical protein
MRRLETGPLRTGAADQRLRSLRSLRGLRGHHEPPEVVWLEPELDDGADDPLLSPEPEELELDDPELVPDDPELVPDEPVPDEPVPDEPELTLVDPELAVPEDDPADDEPDEVEPVEDVVLCEPGRATAMAPAVTTLASPTVAVAVWTRLRPRARDAMARRTPSRFVFIPGSLLPASANGLCTGSQPPMSLDATARAGPWALTRCNAQHGQWVTRRHTAAATGVIRAHSPPGLPGRGRGPRTGRPAARTTGTSKITLVKGYGCGIYCHHGWHD